MKTTLATPISHGIGSAKPTQKTASMGSKTRASTAPAFEPFQTSQAVQAATSVTTRKTISSIVKVRGWSRADQGPP